ncbi:MAG: hypothetical protein QM809_09140 [Gordonia sp. (in: high G+C Gram-positive bacteria)]|uniref:Rv1157c family protein n=1 Tax=Gordonia sp. (in: high G+C Gram-positive bacteria) TaxID=84139 RepID=UPI0039E72B70
MRIARTQRTRAAVAAVSLAAALAVAAPAAPMAHAEPAAPAAQQAPGFPLPEQRREVDKRVLESLGAFAPALIGSVATRDDEGNMNAKLLSDAREMANKAALPKEVSDTWRQLIDFIAAPNAAAAAEVQVAYAPKNDAAKKTKKKAYEIPRGPKAPKIQQFLYPTAGFGCTKGGLFHVGMALTTAGPQDAPAPGPKRGEAGFVFTSLGTGAALNNRAAPLVASWINIDNGRQGTTTLKRNDKINVTAEGPGTFTGIAKTGKGRILVTIHGTVTTANKTGKGATSCGIAPTIGTAII